MERCLPLDTLAAWEMRLDQEGKRRPPFSCGLEGKPQPPGRELMYWDPRGEQEALLNPGAIQAAGKRAPSNFSNPLSRLTFLEFHSLTQSD